MSDGKIWRDEVWVNFDAPRWKCTECGYTEKGHRMGDVQSSKPCPNCGERHLWTGSFAGREPQWSPRAELRKALDELDAKDAEIAKLRVQRDDALDASESFKTQRDKWRERAERAEARALDALGYLKNRDYEVARIILSKGGNTNED